ncbi:hypothetical protein ABT010_28695 [Streptomyces sp. NPDC002668]|uniref:hypothetical protein n=1 Tax=Streptomyces sp. NPDC002668 TaxID=3154422 RepID=UPI00332097C9
MIEAHVRAALRKALSTAAAESGKGAGFSPLNLDDDGSIWAGTGLGFHPWFAREPAGRFTCPQEAVFGLYVIRAALRSAFLATRSISAGDLLRGGRFHAAASAMYYTAAFHGLDGLLANRGRVLVQPVRGPVRPYRHQLPGGVISAGLKFDPLPGDPSVMCGALSRKGTWSFESRGRSHLNRWGELKQLVSSKGSELPGYVVEALSYALGDSMSRKSLSELLGGGIPALARLRHQALYEGFGYDDEAFDAAFNQDNPYGIGLDMRSRSLRNLATGLLSEALTIADLLFDWEAEKRQNVSIVRTRLVLSTLMPAFEFEIGKYSAELDPSTVTAVQRIVDWLSPRNA